MPYPVDGQEDNLGKPLAGQKRDLGKQGALDQNKLMRAESGEKVSVGETTRSAAIALSKNPSQDPPMSNLSSVSGLSSGSEGVDKNPLLSSLSSGSGSGSGSGSVDKLRSMFDQWAKEHKKKYENAEEREKRFKIWCAHKERVDPCTQRDGKDRMYWFADFTSQEKAKNLAGDRISGRGPYGGRDRIEQIIKQKVLDMEYMEKTKPEFKEWAERHKRNYENQAERDGRFLAYLMNKRLIDMEHKLHPGTWTYGYDLDTMDKFKWESSLVP